MINSAIYFDQTSLIENLFDKVVEEKQRGESGYYDLPHSQESLIDEIESYKHQHLDILYGCENIVVVGIGGSSLGAKAIHNALKYRKSSKRMLFLESSDPLKIDLYHHLQIRIDNRDGLFIQIYPGPVRCHNAQGDGGQADPDHGQGECAGAVGIRQ